MVSRICRASRVPNDNKKEDGFTVSCHFLGNSSISWPAPFPDLLCFTAIFIYIRSHLNEWLQNYSYAPKFILSEVPYVNGYPCIAGEGWQLELSFSTRDTPHPYRPHMACVPWAIREQWKKLHLVLGLGTHFTLLRFLELKERDDRTSKIYTPPYEILSFPSSNLYSVTSRRVHCQ